MSPKEAVILVYGFIFGASTPFLKPKNRFLFPTAIFKFDTDKFGSALKFFLGGSGICAELRSESEVLVVNTNQSEAAHLWLHELRRTGGLQGASLVLNSLAGVFGDIMTIGRLSEIQTIYCHVEDEQQLEALAALPMKAINKPVTVSIGSEVVHLIPVSGCATTSDLVVFFEKRSVMMFGSLFSNRIHPQLFFGAAARAGRWIETLEMLLEKYKPQIAIPGEGEFGSADDVREFIRYLKSLTDPAVEFSFCRKNFDWIEIPSATSLEENFDILRRNVKTHTSLN